MSLVASNRLAGEHANHAVAIPGASAKVLRAAVIYGANGAGKSNLFKASFTFVLSRWPATTWKVTGTGREAFRLGAAQDAPSAFDLQFIADRRLCRYVIKVDDGKVIEEWLGEIVDGRERTIFQRGQDRNVTLGDHVRAHPRLEALATVGARPDQSFLSVVSSAILPDPHAGPEIESVLKWPLVRETATFRDDRLFIIACEDTYAPKQYFDLLRSREFRSMWFHLRMADRPFHMCSKDC